MNNNNNMMHHSMDTASTEAEEWSMKSSTRSTSNVAAVVVEEGAEVDPELVDLEQQQQQQPQPPSSPPSPSTRPVVPSPRRPEERLAPATTVRTAAAARNAAFAAAAAAGGGSDSSRNQDDNRSSSNDDTTAASCSKWCSLKKENRSILGVTVMLFIILILSTTSLIGLVLVQQEVIVVTLDRDDGEGEGDDDEIDNNNDTFLIVLASIFGVITGLTVAILYITRLQSITIQMAKQSNKIVSSLFPQSVRNRLFKFQKQQKKNGDSFMGADGGATRGGGMFTSTSTASSTKSDDGYENNDDGGNKKKKKDRSRPIADLFTDCTVLFADIANFTAWSSTRSPEQVFVLLESVYGALDEIATKRGVFKVETIGDSYMCVTGLPDPNPSHASVMCKFARDARECFARVTEQLEVTLGPETGDLALRIGLHSGPVTAGVLRGQKSRFQLFGDTVNTASRMESTGMVNRIQCSKATADLLIKADKKHWITERFDRVLAKGKGTLQTYWVDPPHGEGQKPKGILKGKPAEQMTASGLDMRTDRLVGWLEVVLQQQLQKIIARRNALMRNPGWVEWNERSSGMVIEEIAEIIRFTPFDDQIQAELESDDFHDVKLPPRVEEQLRKYIEAIAKLYHLTNSFHNFEHAAHTTLSVSKLMRRIVEGGRRNGVGSEKGVSELNANEHHNQTYGIATDPLIQFSCVFAALIHDVGHVGVPNTTLVKEGHELAKTYEGRSVAEQNSVNVAWSILMDNQYTDLRDTICETQQEATLFRQLVVNSVMATDIMDKDLKVLRDQRWSNAFSPSSFKEEEEPDDVVMNRKATIVIEHLIQASDVSHTMQYWSVYKKWNERLFMEMYQAFKDGRSDKDPSEVWYKGEIGFFDFYIIPLSKKLKDCGVFGVSSDEYYNYAVQNRNEWEKCGMDTVAGYIEKFERRRGGKKGGGRQRKHHHRNASNANPTALRNASDDDADEDYEEFPLDRDEYD